MYLLHAAIVADRLASLYREAEQSRLIALSHEAEGTGRPSFVRRFVASVLLGVSQASARLASWSDPTSLPSTEALGYR